jgi:hypothetical protein
MKVRFFTLIFSGLRDNKMVSHWMILIANQKACRLKVNLPCCRLFCQAGNVDARLLYPAF